MSLEDIHRLRKEESKKHTPNYHLRLDDESLMRLAKLLCEKFHSFEIVSIDPYLRAAADYENVNYIHELIEKGKLRVFGMKIHAENPRHGRYR